MMDGMVVDHETDKEIVRASSQTNNLLSFYQFSYFRLRLGLLFFRRGYVISVWVRWLMS